MKKAFVLVLGFVISSTFLFAQKLEFPSIFSNNMILQRNTETPIWGWSNPGTSIRIQCSWDNQIRYGHTDIKGKWLVDISTPDAGGPYSIFINQDTIKNVMIGEVWIASGQSNMQWALQQSENFKDVLPDAKDDKLRLFYVAREHSDYPNKDIYGSWEACDSTIAKTFSAVAYYFAKRLRAELDIPIGIIHVSWGGSSAQAWVNHDVLASTESGRYYIDRFADKVDNAKPGILPRNHQSPSSLYNAMLKPLIPFGIRGAIWYQGESNRDRPDLYQELFQNMIKSWRAEWDIGDFPFYYVQIAPYQYTELDNGAYIRDAQRRSLGVANTGMAVTMDIGNLKNIHPTNKIDVGNRLSLWALAKTYKKNIDVYSGPILESVEYIDNEAILLFSSVGSGLMLKGKKNKLFEIAGDDQKFYSAKVKIDGNKLIVKSRKVKNPVAVRYACKNTEGASLFNKEGLPASSFRTDQWLVQSTQQ